MSGANVAHSHDLAPRSFRELPMFPQVIGQGAVRALLVGRRPGMSPASWHEGDRTSPGDEAIRNAAGVEQPFVDPPGIFDQVYPAISPPLPWVDQDLDDTNAGLDGASRISRLPKLGILTI